jgi:2-oxoglutarate ferredoxin oxidoreductase subunit alpha
VVARLKEKVSRDTELLNFYEYDGYGSEPLLLVSYGVTSRAAREAVAQMRQQGEEVAHLMLKTLYPVPESCILQALTGKQRVVVVEMNLGQYVEEIRRLAGVLPVHFFGQMDGELISPETIIREMRS